MQDVDVIEGDICLLKCEVMGNPVPHVMWHKDGETFCASRFLSTPVAVSCRYPLR